MNTKILMQRFAEPASSKSKASFAAIKNYNNWLHSIELGLVTAVLFVSAYIIETNALLSVFNVYA
jgi:hypothetical protein